MLGAYALLVSLAVWGVLVPWHLGQMLLLRATWRELRQRLGSSSVPKKTNSRRILIHGVSVGEMSVAEPIVSALLGTVPQLEIVLTTGNRDGKAMAERLRAKYPEIRETLLLPWDRAGAMLSWVRDLSPDLVAVVETEIWPCLFVSCKQLGIPLCIVNGRIYPRDARRYRAARPFFARILSSATWIGVQNQTERSRFLSIGAAPGIVDVIGNAKFDTTLSPAKASEERLRKLGCAPLLMVAGSTHAPEERWLLEAFLELRKATPDLHLILAPRQVSRCASISRLARTYVLEVATWSSLRENDRDWQVLLIDELGWLSTIYAFADVVVIGGSFVPKGGHNPLEAAAHERAILIGPHTENFDDIVQDFEKNGGLLRLRGEHELATKIGELLANDKKRREIGTRARALLLARRGIAASYANALTDQLKPPTYSQSLRP